MKRITRHLLTGLFGLATLPAAVQAQSGSSLPDDTAASRSIDTLRAQYAARYRDAVKLVVIDPDRLAAIPPWLDAQARFNTLFSSTGIALSSSEARALDMTFSLQQQFGAYHGANVGFHNVDIPDTDLNSSTANAFSLPGVKLMNAPGQLFCVVSPAFTDFTLLVIPALGHERSIRLFNRHEFWHCAEDSMKAAADARIFSGSGLPLDMYQYNVDIIRAETRADMGAVSDMIVYDGEDTSIIPAISAWRAEQLKNPEGHDINHFSGFALAALKREIDAMGVAAWRALPDDTRTATLTRLTLGETLDTRGLRDYLQAVKGKTALPVVATDTRLDGVAGKARARLNAARHLAVYNNVTGAGTEAAEPIRLTTAQLQTLGSWNAVALLEKTATTGKAALTPDSLRRARAKLLDDLRANVRANPANILAGARIIKLNQAYRFVLTSRFAPQPATPAPVARPTRQP